MSISPNLRQLRATKDVQGIAGKFQRAAVYAVRLDCLPSCSKPGRGAKGGLTTKEEYRLQYLSWVIRLRENCDKHLIDCGNSFGGVALVGECAKLIRPELIEKLCQFVSTPTRRDIALPRLYHHLLRAPDP